MNAFGDFHFLRPWWLLLVPVALGLWWLTRRSRDRLRGWRAVMDPVLLDAMTVGGRTHTHGWMGVSSASIRGAGLLAAWLLSIVAVAGPTWRPEPSPFADDPVPVMLLLRAGETMDLSDLLPNRMERARLKAADFAEERKGLPLGLVAYGGSSHLVLPPTRDTTVVATMAAEISPAIMPKPGDDLAGALRLADRALGDAGGSIVVLADTVAEGDDAALAGFRAESDLPVHFLAVARTKTPEVKAIQQAAEALEADVTLMTPDAEDVRSLVRRTAKAPVAIGASAEGTRWAEAGWWLVPLVALLSLIGFRRVRTPDLGETRT